MYIRPHIDLNMKIAPFILEEKKGIFPLSESQIWKTYACIRSRKLSDPVWLVILTSLMSVITKNLHLCQNG